MPLQASLVAQARITLALPWTPRLLWSSPPWFDGPMPLFGGRGGGGDRWFEGGERGGPEDVTTTVDVTAPRLVIGIAPCSRPLNWPRWKERARPSWRRRERFQRIAQR